MQSLCPLEPVTLLQAGIFLGYYLRTTCPKASPSLLSRQPRHSGEPCVTLCIVPVAYVLYCAVIPLLQVTERLRRIDSLSRSRMGQGTTHNRNSNVRWINFIACFLFKAPLSNINDEFLTIGPFLVLHFGNTKGSTIKWKILLGDFITDTQVDVLVIRLKTRRLQILAKYTKKILLNVSSLVKLQELDNGMLRLEYSHCSRTSDSALGCTGDRTGIILNVKKLNVISPRKKFLSCLNVEVWLKRLQMSPGNLICRNNRLF